MTSVARTRAPYATRSLATTCLLCVLLACSEQDIPLLPKPAEVHVGDARAFTVPASAPNGWAAGNLAIEGAQLGVELQATGRPEERGRVIGLRHAGAPLAWEALSPIVSIDGEVLSPVATRTRVAKIKGRAAIEVEATAETTAGGERVRVELRRVFRIADVPHALRITTTARIARGQAPAELQLGERVAFGGGTLLAPMRGALMAGEPVAANWVARLLDRSAVAVGALEGALRVVGHAHAHHHVDLVRHVDAWVPTHKADDGVYTGEVVLSAGDHGVAQAVRYLGWVRGKPFTEAIAMLDTHPPDTAVEVVLASGESVISGFPDDELRVLLPLPDEVLDKPLFVGARARGVEASAWVPLQGPPFSPVRLAVPASSTLEVRITHAGTGEPLPARVRLLPRRNTRAPDLGPDWEARGALDTIISASGHARIQLGAGYYRVIVTHGPEWSLHDSNIELLIGKTTTVHAALERAFDPGAWVPCELHVHSSPSYDSQVSLDDRVASLIAEGIAFAVPTDHNHVTDFGPSIHAQPLWGLVSVPGVEVTPEPGFGHFNAYPYPIDPSLPRQGAPEFRDRAPAELFSSLHALSPDLVVQVNHPRLEGGIGYLTRADYDPKTNEGNELWSPTFDALEVWNGYDLARFANVETVLADWLALNSHGHRVVATGSSDSHTIRSVGAGYPRTYVKLPQGGVGIDPIALVRALRAGRAFVTSGPFISVRIGDKTLGDAVELPLPLKNTHVELNVFVQAVSWMQVSKLRVYLGTRLMRELPLGPPTSTTPHSRRYQRTLRLPIDAHGPLVVAVEGEGTLEPVIARKGVRPFAFTNPIWLVDVGQGPPPAAPPPEPHTHPHADGATGVAPGDASAEAGQATGEPLIKTQHPHPHSHSHPHIHSHPHPDASQQ